ncbi:hypothetical protein CAI21_02080 [Alkalilimnicola ehrlichii]|uniref:Type II secretion system protein K n=1 Tax=Alkalilimnicola ehrlichii TaxID=351052 RepID=A0A3E0X3L6_9GAMM|nr:type II secretion system minor pseudopilin GspK [Alkalilimnicola ehrlichii]RFA31424.1 hypothetical protein CAI21_02080 [Alkalilimnicola ehrlichii]RFA39304.1 hypothetical protein CAL65_00315 [Alkalilimnicola ehrlichii]
MRRFPAKNRQQGIALVTALLVVALATIAAVEMVSRQQLDIRRVQNVLAREQAYSYAIGAELWAMHTLKEKLEQDGPDSDHLQQAWAQPIVLPEFDGAQLQMQIYDAQARFNLNNLHDVQPGDTNNVYVQQFIRLLELAGAEDPPQIANATMDWLDPDMEERPGGAEDGTYTQLEQPYRTANQPMASVSELRLVYGMTPEIYQQIEPYIIALPAVTAVNLNTAQAGVLMGLFPGLNQQLAEQIIEQRNAREDGLTDPNELLQLLPPQSLPDNIDEAVGVSSDFYIADIRVELGPSRVRLRSLIQRSATGELRVISRSQGPL